VTELRTAVLEREADVVEGERDELGEAHKYMRSRRDEAAVAKVEVDKVAKGEEGGDADEVAQYGSPRVKHLDGELLDMLADEGVEIVVGAFQVVQADAGSEAANGRNTSAQAAGLECGA
jgi:hypothetical protein